MSAKKESIMDTVVIYYSSNTGMTKKAISEIKADVISLETVKKIPTNKVLKMIVAGYYSTRDKKVGYQPVEVDFTKYKKVIIAGPTWAGMLANPIREYILDNLDLLQTKDVEIIATCDGSSGKIKDIYQQLLPQARVSTIKKGIKQ